MEYFGALQSIDEGTAFLVNQYAQIPSSGASQAATNFQDLAYLDAGIDLLDHGLREIISSDISTASEEVLTIAEAEDAAALGVDLAPELSELALQGVDLGVGPVLIAAAITALNLQQIIGDSSVGSDLTNMTKCALFVGCGSTPAQLSDFAQTVPNGRQMILQALVRAVMPSYSVVRYADPVYGAPPSAGPVCLLTRSSLSMAPPKTPSTTPIGTATLLMHQSLVAGWFASSHIKARPHRLPSPRPTICARYRISGRKSGTLVRLAERRIFSCATRSSAANQQRFDDRVPRIVPRAKRHQCRKPMRTGG